jgi:hypothetical protein
MSGLLRLWCLAAIALVITVVLPRTAAAQAAKGAPIYVLAIDSDDADEQADALTAALRSHVRSTPGWSLHEATQSLGMLTAAFQCPQRPDASCLERIGDKLKADQFIWGVMAKAPGHQVIAEVHLWSRGKTDRLARETFSDNLKDSNDDSLRKVATAVFTQLLGASGGTLSVHVSNDTGTVTVDGGARTELVQGRVTLTLNAGPHSIEVQAPGFATTRKDVTIDPSTNSMLEVQLAPVAAVVAPAAPSKPLPIQAIAGWSAVGAGGVLIITGIGFGVGWLGDVSDLNTARQSNYLSGSSTPITDPCANPNLTPETARGCNAVNSAHTALVGEVVTFSLGAVLAGVGIYLLATDHPSHAASATPPPAKTGLASFRLSPSVGPGGGSMLVLGQF